MDVRELYTQEQVLQLTKHDAMSRAKIVLKSACFRFVQVGYSKLLAVKQEIRSSDLELEISWESITYAQCKVSLTIGTKHQSGALAIHRIEALCSDLFGAMSVGEFSHVL